MARNSSGGMFGKLVLIGLGAVIGAAMTQKKTETGGTSQTSKEDIKANIKKGLDRLNEQSGGMVDKVKPTVNKAVEKVKTAIDAQQDMMNKEKDALDKANKTLQDDVGGNADKSSSSTTDKSSTSSVSPSTNKPTGGVYGGSTAYTESLKKDASDNSSNKDDSTGSSSSNAGKPLGSSTEYTDSLKKDLSDKSSEKDSSSSNDSTFGK
ncbi:ElaB/YqjD/DUF883 family membrane-anchored ribosome-binding protein [Planomicrobium stackebrandtii]|uniref:ElaB/YqjD/DUF883 family membrane-anchored ribosome-binding protein n=1 Tax=Planomicrobium stackebrandtii TaxID=253160 RepID=A0ABU0GSN5_9BACL|nr:hypothetical protein [Planomicrobium stackebrandtii]MDQ0427959.1 ElaB/YqjD/DUF883 family membrane-anchored ribosome-binding protein [Planomicrobium stackebrandtii]